MSKSFYITTTLPYVNAEPHVGFAMELIRADVIARAKMLDGYDVFFNTGTDEHGQKLWDAAQKEGKDVQDYVDGYAERFRGLKELLGISGDVHFIRTTDEKHVRAAQAFWTRCNERGFIYKKTYQAKYCVGCELNKTDSELDEKGECPIHPNRPLELIDEENYFFKFSAFQEPLLAYYNAHPNFVIPDFRFNEIKSFVESGLEDFSISRLASKMPWGIPVPDDANHVMYVWFDALVNYISTLGWPEDNENFEKYWIQGMPTQYCGKDNLRQQSAMWQAMLMAADLPCSHQIIINGFITGDKGIKMSKSIGNVINPYDVVAEYGTEALRYFLLRELSSFEDSPFTMERFRESYNSGLANGIGNLTSRIMTLSESYLKNPFQSVPSEGELLKDYPIDFITEKFLINEYCNFIWDQVRFADISIQEDQPFKVVKENIEQGEKIILNLVIRLYKIALILRPVLPVTANTIFSLIKENKKPESPLFIRK